MAGDIALIIGNGFSISFNKHHKFEQYADTQNPTKWPLYFGNEGKKLIESFPRLKRFLNEHADKQDFQTFEQAAEIYKNFDEHAEHFIVTKTQDGYIGELTEAFEKDIIPIECRHFLSIAFSNYSIDAKAALNKKWPWYKWIEENRSRISAVCSYNYDLIIELVLEKLNRSYYNEAMDIKFGAIPLYKPHGSCDYETNGIAVEGLHYPVNSYFDNNDLEIKRLNFENILSVRIIPYCVIPNQRNIYSHFRPMIRQEEIFNKKIAEVDYCLIIGHSYADVDKPEIDASLSKLKKGVKVIIANPTPSDELLHKIAELGLESVSWGNYLGPLDSEGRLIKI